MCENEANYVLFFVKIHFLAESQSRIRLVWVDTTLKNVCENVWVNQRESNRLT